MGKWDFTRFGFKRSFGRISYIEQHPCFSCWKLRGTWVLTFMTLFLFNRKPLVRRKKNRTNRGWFRPGILETNVLQVSIHGNIKLFNLYWHTYNLIWPTWGPSEAGRTQVGPMLAPGTVLSGYMNIKCCVTANWNFGFTSWRENGSEFNIESPLYWSGLVFALDALGGVVYTLWRNALYLYDLLFSPSKPLLTSYLPIIPQMRVSLTPRYSGIYHTICLRLCLGLCFYIGQDVHKPQPITATKKSYQN